MRFMILLILIPICSGYSLPGCTDQTALDELEALVESYQFRYQPRLDYFDCADMSTANWRLLKAAGYEPKIALRKEGPNNSHCYAICPLGDGWAGAPATLMATARSAHISHCRCWRCSTATACCRDGKDSTACTTPSAEMFWWTARSDCTAAPVNWLPS